MTKISDLTALTGAGVDEAADLFPIVDMSAAGAARNKKITVAEAKIALDVPTAITELDDVPDVNAPTPSNGDVLTWDSTPGEWVPSAPTTGATTLDGLTDVNAPTPGNGEVLTWDSTPGEWVSQALPGAGAFVLGDATDVDTTGAASGNVLTYDGAQWEPVAPSSGAWRLAGGAYTTPGIWLQSVDGSAAAVDFTGLAGATDIMIIVRLVTQASSGTPIVRVSVDNGATFFAASGDYVTVSGLTGAEANSSGLTLFSTAATAARSGTAVVHAPAVIGIPRSMTVPDSNSVLPRFFVANTADDINAVRILGSAGNLTGGAIYCLIR